MARAIEPPCDLWSFVDTVDLLAMLRLYERHPASVYVENLSYALCDDPAVVEEMGDHQAYMAYQTAKKVFAAGLTLDWVWIWEDMWYKAGPLVSPRFVKEVTVPS